MTKCCGFFLLHEYTTPAHVEALIYIYIYIYICVCVCVCVCVSMYKNKKFNTARTKHCPCITNITMQITHGIFNEIDTLVNKIEHFTY